MGVAAAAMGAGTLLGAGSQYYAAEANKKIARYNASVLDAQAVDAIARGEETATNLQTDARRLAGAQRASLAGQNVDLSSDVADAIAADTQRQLSLDVNTARVNAAREAWGYTSQARLSRRAGQYAYNSALLGTAGSLLTGGAATAGAARRAS
jgi:hypothetical protein